MAIYKCLVLNGHIHIIYALIYLVQQHKMRFKLSILLHHPKLYNRSRSYNTPTHSETYISYRERKKSPIPLLYTVFESDRRLIHDLPYTMCVYLLYFSFKQ